MSKTRAIIFRANHFDPVWRRCWDRPFYDGGRRFASYREIEGYYFDDALESGEAFSCESAWTIRHYLKDRPEKTAEVKRLHEAGKFELLGAGENIIDTNMPGSEALIRNMVIGLLWGRDLLGGTPRIPCFADVFGSSCQLPQLVRECGMIPWIYQLNYNTPDRPVWIGKDGSAVVWGFPANVARCNPCDRISFGKHEPCPRCAGEGCPECGGRGFLPTYTAVLNVMPDPPEAEVLKCDLSGEEILPDRELTAHMEEFNRRSDGLRFEAGLMKSFLPYMESYIALADRPPRELVSSKTENNPCQTGCYVSRIRIKQRERLNENLMAACETWDTILQDGLLHEELKDIWRDITLTCQHDAITGDHIDQASEELEDFGAGITERLTAAADRIRTEGAGFTVYNHHGFEATFTAPAPKGHTRVFTPEGEPAPVYSDGTFLVRDMEGLSGRTYRTEEGEPAKPEIRGEGVYTMDGFTVTAGPRGIEKVEAEGCGVITGSGYYFGEPVLETDIGDPWCTRHTDRTRERLSAWTRLTGVEVYPHEIRINYRGSHPKGIGHLTSDAAMVFVFSWTQTFVLREGLGRIDVETGVNWYTQNCRLRLAFPSVTGANEGLYEVPCAIQSRQRYDQTGYDPLSGAGDWPSVRWFGIDCGSYLFTVMNQGTPSSRIEDGTAFCSILRSPTQPAWLFEPNFYTAYNFCRIADPGEHSFVHSFALCKDPLEAMKKAAAFNTLPFCAPGRDLKPWTALRAPGALITAVKKGEYEGVVIRIIEYAGKPQTAELTLPEGFDRAYACSLTEDSRQELTVRDGAALIPLRPWQIATVKLMQSCPKTQNVI